jgi:transcriptional regulator with XRE-family HTH domain
MVAATEIQAKKRVVHLIRMGRLPELLEERGLFQSEVAAFIGVHPSQVTRWVAGIQNPRPRHAARLLELLDGEEA